MKYPEDEADEREREARETFLKPIRKDPVTDLTKKVTPPPRKRPEPDVRARLGDVGHHRPVGADRVPVRHPHHPL